MKCGLKIATSIIRLFTLCKLLLPMLILFETTSNAVRGTPGYDLLSFTKLFIIHLCNEVRLDHQSRRRPATPNHHLTDPDRIEGNHVIYKVKRVDNSSFSTKMQVVRSQHPKFCPHYNVALWIKSPHPYMDDSSRLERFNTVPVTSSRKIPK